MHMIYIRKQTVTWGLAPHVGSHFMFKGLAWHRVRMQGVARLHMEQSEVFKNGGDAK